MLRVGQPGTIFPGLIHDKHPSAVQAEQRTDNHGSQHIVQIQHHIEIVFHQGRGKTKQSRQRFLRALRIDTDHVHVLRAVDKTGIKNACVNTVNESVGFALAAE